MSRPGIEEPRRGPREGPGTRHKSGRATAALKVIPGLHLPTSPPPRYGSFVSLLKSNNSRVRVSVFSLIITMLSTWYWPFTFLKSLG